MENAFVTLGFGVGEHETAWVDAKHPDFPCTSKAILQDKEVLQECYFIQTALWGKPLEHFNTDTAIAGCMRAPADVRNICFRGIGFNMTMPVSALSDEETAARCKRVPSKDGRDQCIVGALLMRSFFWRKFDDFRNEPLCAAMGYSDLDACDERVRTTLSWIFAK